MKINSTGDLAQFENGKPTVQLGWVLGKTLRVLNIPLDEGQRSDEENLIKIPSIDQDSMSPIQNY